MPVMKNLIYIDLIEAYQSQDISTDIRDRWVFEHAALKKFGSASVIS